MKRRLPSLPIFQVDLEFSNVFPTPFFAFCTPFLSDNFNAERFILLPPVYFFSLPSPVFKAEIRKNEEHEVGSKRCQLLREPALRHCS